MTVDNTRARRLTNLEYGKMLIKAGVYIFPSSGKVPLIPRFNKPDHEIAQDEVEQAIEEHEAKHGEAPVHVGATKDPRVISAMFKRHPDCVWSVACGPNHIVVIDADQKDNGPEKIGKHFDEHGLPEGTVVVPTQSGGRHYIFKDAEGKYTNAAGALKSQYGCDVRGKGGQYIAPGSIREDGKTYGTKKDLVAFLKAHMAGSLPALPEHVAELIGTAGEASQSIAETDLAPIIRELRETDWPDHVDLYEPGIGTYDLESLKASNPEFAELYDNPSDDRSDNRWKLAQMVLQEFKMPVTHLAVLFEGWEGAGTQTDDGKGSGNYNLRDIAREWEKNKQRFKSTGDAFDAVPDEIDDPEDRALEEYSKKIEAERREEREAVAAIESKRGQLHKLSEIAVFCSPDYVIENMHVPGMVGMLHGPSNVGKTFTAWYMALCIAEGWQFFGRNVEQSGVLYCYGEGHAGMQNRALAYKKKYDPKTDHLITRDGIPNFATDLKAAKKALRKAIKDANEQLAASGLKPLKTVFVDTFAKAVAGAEENSTKDMQPILNALRELALELGVCIIIIHHSGKDASRGARGASAIFGDVDLNIEIVDPHSADGKKRKIKADKGSLVMLLPKMRDAAKSAIAEFRLEEITLGVNKWGNPVTSMVVVPKDQPSQADAMGAVIDDEEPGQTSDQLEQDQNRADEEKRLSLLAKVRKVMSEPGMSTVVNGVVLSHLAALERKLKVLADLKSTSGPNYARELKLLLFRGEPAELLDDGWLRFQPGTGRRPSCLTFSPTL